MSAIDDMVAFFGNLNEGDQFTLREFGDAIASEAAAPSLIADAREVERLRAALVAAYEGLNAAAKWAAGETSGVKTVADADRHMAGYDALIEATVQAGLAAGLLRDYSANAALEPEVAKP